MIHVDTSFLVDAIRETRRGVSGPARTWLASHSGEELAISVLVLAELLLGAALHAEPDVEKVRVQTIVGNLPIVPLDESIPPVFAGTAAALQRAGRTVSTMDLLIASAALANGAALLTRNVDHFRRIHGLSVLTY